MSEERGPLKLTHLPCGSSEDAVHQVSMEATTDPSATAFPTVHTAFPYFGKVVPTSHYYFFLFHPMLKIDFKSHNAG